MDTSSPSPLNEPGLLVLKIQGVSGATPEQVLACPREFVEFHSGDKDAGFYRRAAKVGSLFEDTVLGDGNGQRYAATVEAYSWRNSVSGPVASALRLLLLPFTLINLAYWMILPSRRSESPFIAGCLRLLGLVFTVASMAALVGVCVDLAGWQCAISDQCSSGLGPMSFIHELPRGLQLTVAAIPAVILVLPAFRSRAVDLGPRPPMGSADRCGRGFASESFWEAIASFSHLRACHSIAWLSGFAILMSIVPILYSSSWPHDFGLILVTLNAAVMSISVIATATGRSSFRSKRFTPAPHSFIVLQYLALVGAGSSLAVLGVRDIEYPSSLDVIHLPGFVLVVYSLLAVQILLLVVVIVATARVRFKARYKEGFSPAFQGFAAPIAASIAWIVGNAFLVGLALFVARYLGSPVASQEAVRCESGVKRWLLDPADTSAPHLLAACDSRELAALVSSRVSLMDKLDAMDTEAPLALPRYYFGVSLAGLASVVGAVVVVAVTWLWLRYRLSRVWSIAEYGRRLAMMTVYASRAVFALLLVSILSLVWGFSVVSTELDRQVGFMSSLMSVLTGWSQALLAGFATLVMIASYRAIRQSDSMPTSPMLRVLAMLWDVAAFWPKAAHPMVPGTYGERVVPGLHHRITQLAVADPPVPLILAAHSQGSVIAAAALLQLPAKHVNLVSLLTYGSPLRDMYAKYFPAYFGPSVLAEVAGTVDNRWINLWAASDPIGSWIFTSDRSDGWNVDIKVEEPPLCGHAGYENRDDYTRALQTLYNAMRR